MPPKFIRLHDSGKIWVTTTAVQTGSYNFYSDASYWGMEKKTRTNLTGEGDYFLNGSKKGLTAKWQ